MKYPKTAYLSAVLLLILAAGCGYGLSPTPYGLMEAMVVSVPVAKNQSRYADLGPQLTSDVISRLDASSNITVREEAPATLTMTISRVAVFGGAWETGRYDDDDDEPKKSASRVVYVAVEAILERPGPPGGQPLVSRRTFGSSRTFFVNEVQADTELRQSEAFNWVIADLGQKIAQNMFSEF